MGSKTTPVLQVVSRLVSRALEPQTMIHKRVNVKFHFATYVMAQCVLNVPLVITFWMELVKVFFFLYLAPCRSFFFLCPFHSRPSRVIFFVYFGVFLVTACR